MHDHPHTHPDHRAHLRRGSRTSLLWALLLTFGFALVEAVAGWWSGSLALLSDAGHMLSDSTALLLALFAAWVATRPPSATHTFGYGRAETLSALFNGAFMLVLVAAIVYGAINRLQDPQPIKGGAVMGVAIVGLLVNIAVLFVLHRGEQTLNTRGALLHVLGDTLGSVAALVSGAVIHYTGWVTIDPLLSMFICALILVSGIRLLRDALHVILEGVPAHLDIREVGTAMTRVPEVRSVHDLHLWTMGNGQPALAAHIVIADLAHWPAILAATLDVLATRFHIEHVTLQPELRTEMVTTISEPRT